MTKIGIIGCGFVGDIHAAAFRMVPGAEGIAVAAGTTGKAEHFAKERGIAKAWFSPRVLSACTYVPIMAVTLFTGGLQNTQRAYSMEWQPMAYRNL